MAAETESRGPMGGHERPSRRRFSLRLLRGFQLGREDGRAVALPLPAQRVVAFLAAHDCPLQRAFVAGTLWPDNSEAKAFGSLRSALWRLSAAAPDAVCCTSGVLRISPDVTIDLSDLTVAARELGRGACLADPHRLALRFQDDLLPDWYDDWVVVRRERWRQARLHALDALAQQFARAGQFDTAIDCGLAAVAADPLRETSRRNLIEIHLQEGNRTEALREYDAYRTLLARELGWEPAESISELVRSLRNSCSPLRSPVLAGSGSGPSTRAAHRSLVLRR
jgi:DNA-binding SARP family transcriptional activator